MPLLSSSLAPVGTGACWWWETQVPPLGSRVSPLPQRREGRG